MICDLQKKKFPIFTEIPLPLIGKRLFSTAKIRCVWEGGLKVRTHRLVSVVEVLALVEESVFVLLCSGREL